MSINMDNSEASLTGSSYADFRHQAFDSKLEIEDGAANATAILEFEPLEDLGGLEPNQIAELVYVDLWLSVEAEGTQNGGSTELRGSLGANLAASRGELVEEGGSRSGSIDGENIGGSSGNFGYEGGILTGSERFIKYQTHFGPNNSVPYNSQYHMREIYGRGPVLDDQDVISLLTRVVSESGGINGGKVGGKLVFDVAETDDSGRRFSLPE